MKEREKRTRIMQVRRREMDRQRGRQRESARGGGGETIDKYNCNI